MSTTPEEAAANALRTAWLNGKAGTTEGWSLHVEAEDLVNFIRDRLLDQMWQYARHTTFPGGDFEVLAVPAYRLQEVLE